MPSILTSLSLSSLAMTMALFSLAIATLKCEVRNAFLLLQEFLFVFHDFLSLSLYRSLYCEFFLCHLSLIYSHNSAALVPWYFVTQVSLHNFTNKIAYECLTQLNYIAVGMKIICLHCLFFSLIHSWFCVHSADRNLRRIAQMTNEMLQKRDSIRKMYIRSSAFWVEVNSLVGDGFYRRKPHNLMIFAFDASA